MRRERLGRRASGPQETDLGAALSSQHTRGRFREVGAERGEEVGALETGGLLESAPHAHQHALRLGADDHRGRPGSQELGRRLGHQVQGRLQLTRRGQRPADAPECLGLLQGPPQRDGLVLHLTLGLLGILRDLPLPALDFQREGALAEHAIDHDGQRALEPDLLDDVVRGPVLECRDGHRLISQPRHHHDRRLVPRLAERTEKLEAVASRERVIGQDDRERRFPHRRQGRLGVGHDLEVQRAGRGRGLPERALHELPVSWAVVDQEDT